MFIHPSQWLADVAVVFFLISPDCLALTHAGALSVEKYSIKLSQCITLVKVETGPTLLKNVKEQLDILGNCIILLVFHKNVFGLA